MFSFLNDPEGLGILEGFLQECIMDSTERECRHTFVQEIHKQSSIPIVERSWIVISRDVAQW